MDKEAETAFIRYVLDCGLVFIRDTDGTIVNPCEDTSWFYCITRKEYLPLLKFRNNFVDVLGCLVIEYRRNTIIEEEERVTGGRIYISDACKEEQYSNYTKSFIDDYNKLKKWIRAHVPYQSYVRNGYETKEYISDSMLIYAERQYFFQP
jgi:hypothetical protein